MRPHGAPPRDLWDRGRRQHQRQVVGRPPSWSWRSSCSPGSPAWTGPARPSRSSRPARRGQLGLPDQLYAADPHLAGTEDAGRSAPSPWCSRPSARTSPVTRVERAGGGLRHRRVRGVPGPAGHSGVRRLHPGSDLALSADGSKLAYWTTGEPQGAYGGDPAVEPYAGLAVYDTVTGEVWSRPDPDRARAGADDHAVGRGHVVVRGVAEHGAGRGGRLRLTLTQVVSWDSSPARTRCSSAATAT